MKDNFLRQDLDSQEELLRSASRLISLHNFLHRYVRHRKQRRAKSMFGPYFSEMAHTAHSSMMVWAPPQHRRRRMLLPPPLLCRLRWFHGLHRLLLLLARRRRYYVNRNTKGEKLRHSSVFLHSGGSRSCFSRGGKIQVRRRRQI